MIRLLKYLFVFAFICLGSVAVSQKEASKWYFGNYCALDFSTNPPTSLANGAMATWEGCSSVADASGNLLFYTNGIKIWNASHNVMSNGTGLLGDNSSSQSALIVKQPGSATIYFVFTTSGWSNGLSYSIVDMSLDGGLGAVTSKNLPIYSSGTERLCGARHCNGKDVWVITHEAGSNIFRSNLVSAAGVNVTGVLSPIGSVLYGTNSMGCMKVSPNGRKLGTALYSSSFELFDFDAATGLLSNVLSLPVSSPGYGCEFSPDGSKFYGTLWGAFSVTYRMRQWDLCAGSNQAILASASPMDATHTGQLQLGPDGKIYQARAIFQNKKLSPELYVEVMTGESVLGVIHNPNASAASQTLNFNNTAQVVSPAMSMFGLPNFVAGFYKTPVAPFSYSFNPATSCVKAFFSAPPLINTTCSATSYTISSVKWLFGDPASAAADSSTQLNPDHVYPGMGNYAVRLVLYNACGGVIDTLRQNIPVGGALLPNASAFAICSGQSSTLTAASASSTYSWSTGSTAASIVVTPTATSTYSLSYNDAFGCAYTSVQTITVNPLPPLTLTGKDTLCEGAYTKLTATGAVTYSWSNNTTHSAISPTPAVSTSYTVTGTSIFGCSVSKVMNVVVKTAPIPSISGDTLICDGYPATVVASGATGNFVWNNGVQGPTMTVVPNDMQYVFSVKATYTNGCTRSKRVWFYVQPLPFLNITGGGTVCAGAGVTLTATGANTYSWSNGLTTNPMVVKPLTNVIYKVVGTSTNNCKSAKTVTVVVKPSAIASASVSGSAVICEGESTFLSAAGGNVYRWEPAISPVKTDNSAVVASPSVSTVYSVNVSVNGGCGITKTVLVSVKPKPRLSAGRDTLFNLEEPMFITASGTGTITWIGGEGIACADCPHTQVFPVQNTCYLAEAINDQGCITQDEVCVNVGKEHGVYMPSAFTPNGDGLNDEFTVSGFGISSVKLSIFNRWGENVFSSDTEKTGWNGSFRGQPCPMDSYNWVLEYISVNGRWQQKTGLVSLLR